MLQAAPGSTQYLTIEVLIGIMQYVQVTTSPES
jgi:hypothetical protein